MILDEVGPYNYEIIITFDSLGRAWLRAAINERTLENYLHTMLSDLTHIRQVTFDLYRIYYYYNTLELYMNHMHFSLTMSDLPCYQ